MVSYNTDGGGGGGGSLTKLAWSKDEVASKVALGSSNGTISVLQLAPELYASSDTDYLVLNETLFSPSSGKR